MTPDKFIATLGPAARAAVNSSHIPASVIVAQAVPDLPS